MLHKIIQVQLQPLLWHEHEKSGVSKAASQPRATDTTKGNQGLTREYYSEIEALFSQKTVLTLL